MKKFIIVFFLLLTASCSFKEVEIQKIDKFLSITEKNNDIYFRSKGTSECPNDYFYSDSALETVEDHLSQQREVRTLSNLIDLNTLKFNYSVRNQYYFEDDNFKYLVLLTICDNTVTYEKKDNDVIQRDSLD